jgi:hypothetical protein
MAKNPVPVQVRHHIEPRRMGGVPEIGYISELARSVSQVEVGRGSGCDQVEVSIQI